jgi:hypothetical protein
VGFEDVDEEEVRARRVALGEPKPDPGDAVGTALVPVGSHEGKVHALGQQHEVDVIAPPGFVIALEAA